MNKAEDRAIKRLDAKYGEGRNRVDGDRIRVWRRQKAG